MKTLKKFSILFLSVLIISCSKKDDGDGGGGEAPEAEFSATINGGGFGSNYSSRLGFYSSDYGTDTGLTLAVTDENTNIVRIFLNNAGGYGSGITKVIGEVSNGFVTNVIIRDQTNQVTYNSSAGEINITENKENPESEDGRLISGNFTITATSGAGPTITMTGSFKNFAY
ncbi:MAG TPA: hypothetical protein VFM72_05440 [Aequorivita sp.]|nr:hypothetical protein [Aequorivita sp.]